MLRYVNLTVGTATAIVLDKFDLMSPTKYEFK